MLSKILNPEHNFPEDSDRYKILANALNSAQNTKLPTQLKALRARLQNLRPILPSESKEVEVEYLIHNSPNGINVGQGRIGTKIVSMEIKRRQFFVSQKIEDEALKLGQEITDLKRKIIDRYIEIHGRD
jgi:hypothetical protein